MKSFGITIFAMCMLILGIVLGRTVGPPQMRATSEDILEDAVADLYECNASSELVCLVTMLYEAEQRGNVKQLHDEIERLSVVKSQIDFISAWIDITDSLRAYALIDTAVEIFQDDDTAFTWRQP